MDRLVHRGFLDYVGEIRVTRCAFCGREPLHIQTNGRTVKVDACFQGALLGDTTVSGYCGHGDRDRAYVRLQVKKPAGTDGWVDLCGFVVQPLLSFRDPEFADRYPALNVAAQ